MCVGRIALGSCPEYTIWGALPQRGHLMLPGDAVLPLRLSPCANTRHEDKTDEKHQRWLEEEEWGLNTGQGLFGVSQSIGTKSTGSLKKTMKKKTIPQILKQLYCLGF